MNPEITKIIDQYLNGELSEKDQLAFEDRLQKNPKLQEEVQLQKDVVEGIKRSAQRGRIKKTKRNYHRSKILKWGIISLSSIAVIGLITYFTVTAFANRIEPISDELKAKLDQNAQFDQLDAQYFQIPEEGGFVMTEKGVLLSVPENAFLKDGKPYSGATIIQFQEAMDAEDIVISGLSTMSGDRLLETQGMFSLRSYTKSGEELEINPKVGVYVQAPVDGYQSGMQLFSGEKDKNGNMDWQNPEPLMKIPVPVDMAELDFYPVDYEPYLYEQRWNKNKKSRDSLYLSFEDYYAAGNYLISEGAVPACKITREEREYLYNDNRPIDRQMTEEEAIRLSKWKEGPRYDEYFKGFRRDNISYSSDLRMYMGDQVDTIYEATSWDDAVSDASPCYIFPSKVLGFWNQKFNNTNLSTREFEKRMREIHSTCDNNVLDKYISQLNKPISAIDKQVAAMGYPQFEKFAAENVGKIDVNNAHIENLKAFYEDAVNQLKTRSKKHQNAEEKRKNDWDSKTKLSREKEKERSVYRETQAIQEEYEFNLKNARRQINASVGFTIKHGGGTVYNIDKYVMDATVNRESMDRIDPVSGKRVQLTYNDFSFTVPNAEKYIKLYAYIFPHQLNSFQRISGENGVFSYPLNDDILYDMAVVGITENGYEFFQKQTFKQGELGAIVLKKVSEKEMKVSIEQLNKKRTNKPINISNEVKWLIQEQADYKEQKLRKEMDTFRQELASKIFPCMFQEYATDQYGFDETPYGLK